MNRQQREDFALKFIQLVVAWRIANGIKPMYASKADAHRVAGTLHDEDGVRLYPKSKAGFDAFLLRLETGKALAGDGRIAIATILHDKREKMGEQRDCADPVEQARFVPYILDEEIEDIQSNEDIAALGLSQVEMAKLVNFIDWLKEVTHKKVMRC